MGCAISWIGVHTTDPLAVQTAFGLHGTGEFVTTPGGESPVCGVMMPQGWYIIEANDCVFASSHEAVMKRLSITADVVTCAVEEHQMFSMAEAWCGGKMAWHVWHDASYRGVWHLEVEGQPPGQFSQIRAQCEEDQRKDQRDEWAADHLFEVPVMLAVSITGYEYCGDLPEQLGERPFEVLAPLANRPWWQRLF